MRKVTHEQLQFGEVDISHVKFDLQARDEIPKLLLGLQHMYCDLDLELREKVFTTLERLMPQEIDTTTGRPGMELWKILVLGTLRGSSAEHRGVMF